MRRTFLSITNLRAFAHTQPKEVQRFLKFAVVGALGAVTDFGVLNLLVQLFALPLYLANTFSFLAALIQNFLFNRYWTYPETRGNTAGKQLLQFALVSVIGLAINQAVLLNVHALLEPYWQTIVSMDWSYTVSYNFAKVTATGIVLFWNFLANRYWTYKDVDN